MQDFKRFDRVKYIPAHAQGSEDHHGKVGIVVASSKGRPRNHGVMIDGELVCIPCGNLRKVECQEKEGSEGNELIVQDTLKSA